MIVSRNRHSKEFEQLGEEGVRSAIALGEYVGAQLTAAQKWLDRREQHRARQYKVENRKANAILAVAMATGALIVSLAAID